MTRISLPLILLPLAAFAQRTAVIPFAVGTDTASEDTARRLELSLSRTLAGADARLDVLPALTLTSPGPASARAAAAQRAEKLLTEATAARAAFALDAAERYEAALTAFEKTDWRDTFERSLDALAWAGALGQSDTALKLLFTLRPDYHLPAINPDIDAFVEEHRAAKREAASVEFTVKANVPAAVWLDGAFAGLTPLTLRALAGRHLLSAEASGYELLQQEALVTGGSVVELKLRDTGEGANLRAALAAVAGGFRTGDYLVPVKRLAELARGPEVLVAGVQPGESVTLVRMSKAGEASVVKLPNAQLDAVVRAVRELYDRPLGVNLAGPDRRTLSYVSFGAGGAVLATGIALIAAGAAGFAAANQIPQTEVVRYERAVAPARGLVIGGVTASAVGLAGVAVGSWLFATSQPLPTRPDVETGSTPSGDEWAR